MINKLLSGILEHFSSEITDTTKIDLPLPIIKNIKKLVQDQNTVQGIINDMKTTLDPTKTFGDKPDHRSENVLNEKILPTPTTRSGTPP